MIHHWRALAARLRGLFGAPIGIYRDRFGEIVYNSHLQQHELRQAVEQSLRHCQPCALLIDEAQHIAKVASARRLQDQVDGLKFLAQQSRTLMVLIGTYELQSLRNLSGQLSRRSRHLHFSRYGTSAEDLKVFRSIIYNLQLHLNPESSQALGIPLYAFDRLHGHSQRLVGPMSGRSHSR
jgi:hypothetical protein